MSGTQGFQPRPGETASEMSKRAWQTRKARMIADGWTPPSREKKTPEEVERSYALRRASREAAAKAVLDSRPHFVRDCRMRVRDGEVWSTCQCGVRFEEGSVEETARAINRHVWEALHPGREFPVERSLVEEAS